MNTAADKLLAHEVGHVEMRTHPHQLCDRGFERLDYCAEIMMMVMVMVMIIGLLKVIDLNVYSV